MDDDGQDGVLDLAADWKRLRPRPGGPGRSSFLLDKRFGRLLVLERVGSDKHGASLWRCGCDCGNEKIVSRPHLVSGRVKSCGCLRTEYRKSPKPRVMALARAVRRAGTEPLTTTQPVGFQAAENDPDFVNVEPGGIVVGRRLDP